MKTLAFNRQVKRDYEILETFEAGLVLKGNEAKAAKAGQLSLKGAYIRIDQNQEVVLVGSHIGLYQKASIPDYKPKKDRKLLLHKKEIKSLLGKLKQKGLTLMPICVYTKRGFIKLKFGVARGKKKRDKRQDIKRKEAKRRIERTLRTSL